MEDTTLIDAYLSTSKALHPDRDWSPNREAVRRMVSAAIINPHLFFTENPNKWVLWDKVVAEMED